MGVSRRSTHFLLLLFLMAKLYGATLIFILCIGAVLRIYQLGHSHFYGDETKALYYKKSDSAISHFFNQRKAPGQFLVAWGVEQLTNSYDEFYMRLPFALASIFSIYILFLAIKKLFGDPTALVAAFLFAINGFYIAFGRTVQYQAFYVLFGLASLTFYLYANSRKSYLFFSGLFMGIAFLFHYDAVFFLFPLVAVITGDLLQKKERIRSLLFLILPLVILPLLFYLPYIIYGSFLSDAVAYVWGRKTGVRYRPSSSLYTFLIYNPLWILLAVNFFAIYTLKFRQNQSIKILLIWFVIPFILFELIFKSVGTHIHNYILPLIILSSVGLVKAMQSLRAKTQSVLASCIMVILFFVLVIQTQVYIPAFNTGYPWKDTMLLGLKTAKLDQTKDVYVYGFPYYRAWDQINAALAFEEEGRFYFSNDNVAVSEFYMRQFKLYDGRATKNYIHIYNNQLGNSNEIDERYLDTSAYVVYKDFYVDGEKVATIYTRTSINRH